jgi:AbrB family looped-hinge helix DNA binding protein
MLMDRVVRRYLAFVKTTVSAKGQIIIPAEVRREDDFEPGDEFEIERLDRGEYLLKRTRKKRNEGLVKLLLSCPVKGWFQPLKRTETTDDIKPLGPTSDHAVAGPGSL